MGSNWSDAVSCAEENATQEQLRLWNSCREKCVVNMESITSGSDIATNRTYNYSRDEKWRTEMSNSSFKTNKRNIKRDASCCCQVSRTSVVVSSSRRIAHAHAHESVLFYFLFTLSRGLMRAKWILDFAKQQNHSVNLCLVYALSTVFSGIHLLFMDIACVVLKETTW